MTRSTFRTLLYTALISAIFSVLTMNWLVNEDPLVSFLRPSTIYEYKNPSIENVDIEFRNNTIHLHVVLKHPLTCEEVYEKLGIQPIPIKHKKYVPSCEIIDIRRMDIVYHETIEI